MPALRGDPMVPVRQCRDSGDGPLAALLVAVQQLDRPRPGGLDDLPRGLVAGVVRIADGALPESDVAGRDVQVAGLRLEVLNRWRLLAAMPLGIEDPAMQHGQSTARVAERHREVDDAVLRPHRAVAAAYFGARAAPGQEQ